MEALYMHKISFYPTLKCNLRCKLCAVSSPYYEAPYHPEMQRLCGHVDRYFEIVHKVGMVSISGGEPFIRSDLSEFIMHIAKHSDKVNQFDVVTNGSIVPGDKLVDSFSALGSKLRIIVDDYGPNLSRVVQKVCDKLSRLKEAKVEMRKQYDGAYCGGWVDYGISESSRKKSDEEAKQLYTKCAYPTKIKFCASIVDGILYPCAPLRRFIELNVIEARPDETFDLYDKTYTDDEIRERIAALYSKDVLSACAYCNGLCDDSVRYAPAEQLPQLA